MQTCTVQQLTLAAMQHLCTARHQTAQQWVQPTERAQQLQCQQSSRRATGRHAARCPGCNMQAMHCDTSPWQGAATPSRCKLPGHQHVSAHHPMYAQKQPDCQQQLRGTTCQHKPQPVHHRVHIAAPHLSQQQPLAANSKPHMLSFVMLSIQSLAARQPTCARSSQAFSSSPGALPAIMYRSV